MVNLDVGGNLLGSEFAMVTATSANRKNARKRTVLLFGKTVLVEPDDYVIGTGRRFIHAVSPIL